LDSKISQWVGAHVDDELISDGPVLLDLDQAGVARIRLNRPDAANGMNVELLQALHEAIVRCHGDERVRVVVLSGAGKHFCAGGDVRTFASQGEQLPGYLREATAWLQLATSALVQLRAPVIAQVHGFAAGGGGFGGESGGGAASSGSRSGVTGPASRTSSGSAAQRSAAMPARITGRRAAISVRTGSPSRWTCARTGRMRCGRRVSTHRHPAYGRRRA